MSEFPVAELGEVELLTPEDLLVGPRGRRL
jgi:hypothetical protein